MDNKKEYDLAISSDDGGTMQEQHGGLLLLALSLKALYIKKSELLKRRSRLVNYAATALVSTINASSIGLIVTFSIVTRVPSVKERTHRQKERGKHTVKSSQVLLVRTNKEVSSSQLV